jgi:hypothetical protein
MRGSDVITLTVSAVKLFGETGTGPLSPPLHEDSNNAVETGIHNRALVTTIATHLHICANFRTAIISILIKRTGKSTNINEIHE